MANSEGGKVNHKDWVRGELKGLSESLGFRYIPKEELENRLTRLRRGMEKKGIETLLAVQKMDCYYLSGTTQDGLLFVPLEGKPLLMIRREVERARVESPLEEVLEFKSVRELPSLIRDHWGRLPQTLGLELDVLAVRDYFRYQDLFPGTRFMDVSPVIRDIRKIKSPFEIELMRVAGDIGKKVYQEAREILKEGMTEIEFGGLLEAAAKRYGHEGLLRVRSLNYEAYTWHVLSGPSGGIVSQSDSPMGGLGLSPAFPVGASLRVMRAHEPILVDFGTCYHGYQADETRMFSIGEMGEKFFDAYNACREIHDAILDETRPGADCEAIFQKSLRLAEKLGYSSSTDSGHGGSYLGPPGLQTRFIAHGIGLELNELPFLAQGQSYPLEEGMTFAVEPKIVFPGEGYSSRTSSRYERILIRDRLSSWLNCGDPSEGVHTQQPPAANVKTGELVGIPRVVGIGSALSVKVHAVFFRAFPFTPARCQVDLRPVGIQIMTAGGASIHLLPLLKGVLAPIGVYLVLAILHHLAISAALVNGVRGATDFFYLYPGRGGGL
jgi:Xaa-Pro aminopeptidase